MFNVEENKSSKNIIKEVARIIKKQTKEQNQMKKEREEFERKWRLK